MSVLITQPYASKVGRVWGLKLKCIDCTGKYSFQESAFFLFLRNGDLMGLSVEAFGCQAVVSPSWCEKQDSWIKPLKWN